MTAENQRKYMAERIKSKGKIKTKEKKRKSQGKYKE